MSQIQNNTPSAPARFSFDRTANWWSENRTLLALSAILSMIVVSTLGWLTGSAALSVGTDPDDILRFVQIRDLLEGQGWSDTRQDRLGIEGTAIHWSRLADLPFLVVAWPLSMFLDADTAIRVAGTVVPPLFMALVAVGLLRGYSTLNGGGANGRSQRLGGSALLVTAFFATGFYTKFDFGSFDHHHLQLGLLTLALGLSLVRKPSRGEAAAAGLCLGFAAVVGLEGAILIAILCGVWAFRWALETDREASTFIFGIALAVAAALGLALFTGDSGYAGTVCDAFGPPVAGLLILGGLGLSGLAWLGTRYRPGLWMRISGLGSLGLLAVAALAVGAPECASDPLAVLPETVRANWLDRVQEARPLMGEDVSTTLRAYILGPAMLAVIVGAVVIWRSEPTRVRTARLIVMSVLCAAFALTLYQIRFSFFLLAPIALFVGSVLIGRLNAIAGPDHVTARARLLRLFATVGLIFGGTGYSWAVMAEALKTSSEDTTPGASDACKSSDAMATLDSLPPGLVFTSLNTGPVILLETSHRAFASNYHRGWADLERVIAISEAETAQGLSALRDHGVDYLYICEDEDGPVSPIPGMATPALYLERDQVPGLRRLALDLPEGVSVYAVE